MSVVNTFVNEISLENTRCLARLNSNPFKQCKNKRKSLLHDFCGLHCNKSNTLKIDEPINLKKNLLIYSDLIKANLNYNNLKKSDIIFTLKNYNINYSNNKCNDFITLHNFFRELEFYKNSIDKVIYIQNFYRKYRLNKINILRGPGLFNRELINNETDFLSFENCKSIPNSKFFSYKDIDGFVYGFNIQSIKYLKENNPKNPYNRKDLTSESIINLDKLIKYEENLGNNLSIKFDIPEDLYSKMKQKCIKIFQRMDELELYTQPRWFLDLDCIRLKNLYSSIEDIWNYRAMLTDNMKLNYTKTGRAFCHSIFDINRINSKIKLQEILLDEFEKFAFQGKTDEDCTTSCYWILTGLTIVSLNAAEGYPELVQSISYN